MICIDRWNKSNFRENLLDLFKPTMQNDLFLNLIASLSVRHNLQKKVELIPIGDLIILFL